MMAPALWECVLTAFAFILFFGILSFGAYGCYVRATRGARPVSALEPLGYVISLGLLANAFLIAGMLRLYSAWGVALIAAVCLHGLRFVDLKSLKPKLQFSSGARSWIWLVFPLLYFLARWMSTTIPQQHSDPLYYHVYAPKYWADLGRIVLEKTHPSFAQATLWESIYGVPSILLKNTAPLFRNVATLLFAQQMHFLWGQVLTVWVGAHVIARLSSKRPLRSGRLGGRDFFFAWLACVPGFFEWTGTVAKTDYFSALFAAAAFLAILEEKWLCVGLLLGFAYATKVFAFWTILALPLVVPPRFWMRTLTGLCAGVAPVLVRNLIFLGNPFFPALDARLGPGWLSQKWVAANASFVGAPSFSGSLAWLRREVFAKPLAIVNFGVLLAVAPILARRKRGLKLLLFILVQFAIGVAVLKGAAEGRYLGPTLVCAALLGYGTLPLPRILAIAPACLFCLLGFWVNTPLDVLVRIPKQNWFAPADAYLVKFLPVYSWQKWANENLPRGARFVSLNEKQNYFLNFPSENTVEMKEWEDLIQKSSAPALIRALKARGYNYFHYYPRGSRFAAWFELPHDIDASRSACILCSKDSIIVDLRRSR